jgi:hypothetical protein
MVGLVDAAAMPRLHTTQPGPVAAPTARPALAGRGRGGRPWSGGPADPHGAGSSRHGWPAPTPAGRRPGSPRRKGG